MIIVRELNRRALLRTPRDLRQGAKEKAVNTMSYTRAEIERVARMAFALAGKRRKQADQRGQIQCAGNLSALRKVVSELAADFPESDWTIWWTTARCS